VIVFSKKKWEFCCISRKIITNLLILNKKLFYEDRAPIPIKNEFFCLICVLDLVFTKIFLFFKNNCYLMLGGRRPPHKKKKIKK